jgi:hypothetical protein
MENSLEYMEKTTAYAAAIRAPAASALADILRIHAKYPD